MNIQTLPTQAEIDAALGLDTRGRRQVWVRRLMWMGLAVLLVAGGVFAYVQTQSQTSTVNYQTVPAKIQNLVVKVQATGNVQPTTQVDVSSERSGVIRTVNVKANSLVKKGDVLADLDPERLQAELTRIEASLMASEAKLADARATLEQTQLSFRRAERLSKQGISAVQDLDTARAAQSRAEAGVMAAEADIAVVKAEMAMQETDIAKMRILSPVNGIVLKRAAEPGQTVASSLQAPVLFTLAEDLARMELRVDVDEADIGRLAVGNEATFTVDAYPGRSFPARITKVRYAPETTDGVVTYKAILSVDNSEGLLRPGMTATATIAVTVVEDTMRVPSAALRFEPPQTAETGGSRGGSGLIGMIMPRRPSPAPSEAKATDTPTVWVLQNGVATEVEVEAGESDGKLTAVHSDELTEGDLVIIDQTASG